MKKAILLLFLALFLIPSIAVYAHSGGTDSNGGHYNHSTGEYHYHHGKPAHDHKNGVCPYDSSAETEDQDDIWVVVLISSAVAWLCGLIFKEHADFMWWIFVIGIIGMIVSVIAFIV